MIQPNASRRQYEARMHRVQAHIDRHLDARPCFEHYGPASRFDYRTGVFDCELCIPVAPL